MVLKTLKKCVMLSFKLRSKLQLTGSLYEIMITAITNRDNINQLKSSEDQILLSQTNIYNWL